jgi:hypothetical protein
MTMRQFTIVLLALLVAPPAWAQTRQPSTSAAAIRADVRKAIEHTAADPSLRSTIATPSIDFSAELAKDKKTATVKAGFALGEAFTLEGGFTGAFSDDDDRSPLANVRGLGTGSKGWAGLTYKKYRLSADLPELQRICWEYLWSIGEGLFDAAVNCTEGGLPRESFAARLAAATPGTGVRAVCQRFLRALATGPTATPAIDCDAPDIEALLSGQISVLAERGSMSYRARASQTGANLLDLCNEYRRSIGKPPTGETCKPSDLPDKSWQEQFEAARQGSSVDQLKVDICNQYRAAKGLAPATTADCAAAAAADPLFTQSFHDRYAAAYHWGLTPIVSARYEANRSKFSHLDDALVQQDPHHTSGAFLVDVGFLTSGGTLVTAGYRYADVWKAKSSVSLCRPISGTDAASCAPAILTAPTEKKTHGFEAQAKRFVTRNIAAQVVWAIDQDRHWQIDVPVYFIPDKDSKGLTGGLVASYQREEKRWDVSVFVGQRFTLFD